MNITIVYVTYLIYIVIKRRRNGNVVQYSIPYKSAKDTQLALGDMRIL